MKKRKILLIILNIISSNSRFLASSIDYNLQENALINKSIQLIVNFYKEYIPSKKTFFEQSSENLNKLLDHAKDLISSNTPQNNIENSRILNQIRQTFKPKYIHFVQEYINDAINKATEISNEYTSIINPLHKLISMQTSSNNEKPNLKEQDFNECQGEIHICIISIQSLLKDEDISSNNLDRLIKNIEKIKDLFQELHILIMEIKKTEEKLNRPLMRDPSKSSFSNSIYHLIFNRNIGKDYWHFYKLESKLSEFQKISHRKDKELLLTETIQSIYANYKEVVNLIFHTYLKKETNILNYFNRYMPENTVIVSIVNEKSIHISGSKNDLKPLEDTLKKEGITKEMIEELFSNKNIHIPPSIENNLSKNEIENIKYIWFLNLHIEKIHSNNFYSLFTGITNSWKKTSEIILQIENIHKKINEFYRQDLIMIEDKYNAILKFTINEFKKNSDIEQILYTTQEPIIIKLILNTDSLTEKIETRNIFNQMTTSNNFIPALPKNLSPNKKGILSKFIQPIHTNPIYYKYSSLLPNLKTN